MSHNQVLTAEQSAIRRAFELLITAKSELPFGKSQLLAICNADRPFSIQLINQNRTPLKYSDKPNAAALRQLVFEVEWELVGPSEVIRDNHLATDPPHIAFILEKMRTSPADFSDSDIDDVANKIGSRVPAAREAASAVLSSRLKASVELDLKATACAKLQHVSQQLGEVAAILKELGNGNVEQQLREWQKQLQQLEHSVAH